MRRRRNNERHLVGSLDGGPIDHAGYPICLELAESGTPIDEVGFDEVNEIDPSSWPEPVLIDVGVRGDATLWPLLPFEPMRVTIPVGCDLETLIRYLYFCDPALSKAAEIDGVSAWINGEYGTAAQILCQADEVTLTLGTPATALVPV